MRVAQYQILQRSDALVLALKTGGDGLNDEKLLQPSTKLQYRLTSDWAVTPCA